MKILRQVIGIDVAQKELVVCLGRLDEELTINIHSRKTFANTSKGFQALMAWKIKLTDPNVPTRFVMEATGVYHESLAYFLADQSEEVSIVLPNKISNYFKTLEVKTITDPTSAEAITRFGLERKLVSWRRPKPLFKTVRQLCRERDQIVQERTMVKNHLHAEMAEGEPNKTSLTRLEKRIAFLNKQEKQIKDEISLLVKKDEQVSQAVKIITSIPGVGALSAAVILSETNGFELIRNKRQLSSYAGLDVRDKTSGTSVKAKPQISKRGNRYLRKAMHMPALVAIRYDGHFKDIFVRLVSKHGIKMKAIVAVQRKLLELTYTLFKTNTPFNKNLVSIPSVEAQA